MTYLEWNDQLAEHFFSPAKAGRKVHLFATQELIDKLGQASGESFSDFVEAVKTGPPWAHRSGLCQRALEALTDWRSRSLKWPPYIAYLVLFVIAGGIEENFPAHSYYRRLRKVVGEEPEPRALPSFDKMFALWDDLERWSNIDQEGERGVFQIRWLGDLIYVGLPRAQTLLSEEELHRLPVIFARAGLDPTAIPSDREIPTVIIRAGREFLRNRTLRTLKSTADSDAESRQALIEVIAEELRDWDGETFEAAADAGESLRYQTGALRLCCDLDRTAARARMSFRARIPGEFPEEGLLLHQVSLESARVDQALEFVCEEWGRGWSYPLETTSGIVNAANFDWAISFQLTDSGNDWRFRFAGSRVRILVEGSGESLPGLVEVRRLPSQSKFYLLVSHADGDRINSWGASSCDAWEELTLSGGLPLGWRAFSAAKARTDESIRDVYPALSLPVNVALSLQGGIRVSRSNRYFEFAPPAIAVEGQNVDRLLFNEVDAGPPNELGQIKIPPDLPTLPGNEPGTVLIEARRGEQTLDRRTLYLVRGGWSWTTPRDGFSLSPFGETADGVTGHPSVRGAQVAAITVAEFDFASAMPVVEHGSIHYVGREAGQIVHWPAEPMPEDWSPVWVIVSRRRGEVIFCGTSPAVATPIRGVSRDRKKLKTWKDFLWARRKQLRPPAHVTLRKLWQNYQEIARDV
jgi:hypothetical protein